MLLKIFTIMLVKDKLSMEMIHLIIELSSQIYNNPTELIIHNFNKK